MDISKLMKEIHQNNIQKGFYDNEKNIGEMICLIHSEVTEVLEADRERNYTNLEEDWHIKGMADKNFGRTYFDDFYFKNEFEKNVKNTFEDELADILIRVFDLAEYKGIDIENHILAKVRYNKMRPYKHDKAY